MTISQRAVAVMQLPEIRSPKQVKTFFRDMQRCIDAERPFVVLDCSNLRHLDKSGVHLLLCCLEEAMKRNGDLKLAGLHASAETALATFGAYRLFDIHDTTASAVSSFHRIPSGATSQRSITPDSRTHPESAA
ncbi:MAG TPA: STAS domain-containing protein [Acidobacteriaceae bacterium]|jgi:anti-anti-sigma factor|nr:STAS domain-containing protein [Acidobacteriaceae bacterium]